ncbi:zinc finger MYM-type protein 1-like [Gossypium australe]|uniref:Zinc finger MYM-type protein 1-like n=1 Tax=Gossypium australe TaxID=47621 RepID=A0A5B6WME1_9ROSI|nr:zinc finger MYM-type protein 1-like [Gossypium australe]
MEITDILCQALQRHSQYILNVMSLVSTTKDLIQKLRENEWDELLNNVTSFFETWELDVPDTNARYIVGRSRSKKEDITLLELNSRFNETTTLDPKEFFKFFDIEKICALVNKFYPTDFSQQEKERLLYELKHYELDACQHPELRKILTLFDLCKKLVESGKSVSYPLVDKLIHLILTLSVSIASIEHVFSAMKIVKTKFCTKMEDDFLKNSLVV